MSISGSQEVKTAIFRPPSVQGGSDSTAIDAQEDREVLGINVQMDPPDGVSSASKCETFIGTRPFPSAGAAHDNRSFFHRTHLHVNDDATNGVGYATEDNETEWFGEGSGIEWNEDATMTVRISEDLNNGAASAVVTVYYREL